MKFYDAGRREGSFDRGIELALRGDAGQPEVHLPRRARSGGRRRRAAPVSRQRPRAGVAAVVLPVEQHSGRRAAGRWPAGAAAQGRRARAAGAPDARRSAVAGAGRRISPGSGCTSGTCGARRPTRTTFPTSTTTCGRRSSASWSCSSGSIIARGPQRPRPDDRRLHVRERAAGEALRHSERLRSALPPRRAHGGRRARGCWARAAFCS